MSPDDAPLTVPAEEPATGRDDDLLPPETDDVPTITDEARDDDWPPLDDGREEAPGGGGGGGLRDVREEEAPGGGGAMDERSDDMPSPERRLLAPPADADCRDDEREDEAAPDLDDERDELIPADPPDPPDPPDTLARDPPEPGGGGVGGGGGGPTVGFLDEDALAAGGGGGGGGGGGLGLGTHAMQRPHCAVSPVSMHTMELGNKPALQRSEQDSASVRPPSSGGKRNVPDGHVPGGGGGGGFTGGGGGGGGVSANVPISPVLPMLEMAPRLPVAPVVGGGGGGGGGGPAMENVLPPSPVSNPLPATQAAVQALSVRWLTPETHGEPATSNLSSVPSHSGSELLPVHSSCAVAGSSMQEGTHFIPPPTLRHTNAGSWQSASSRHTALITQNPSEHVLPAAQFWSVTHVLGSCSPSP